MFAPKRLSGIGGLEKSRQVDLARKTKPSYVKGECLKRQNYNQKSAAELDKYGSNRYGVITCCSAENGSNGAQVENVVIIGSGPAGYTAAIYASRANLKPLVFEGFQAGGVRGGQLMTTTEVENFPGFPEGITGPDLMDRMRLQAARWGSELFTEDVEEVDFGRRPFRIKSSEREVRAHSVIFATGATAMKLGLPSEEEFWSRVISACAICDGASPQFRNQELAVVGGGDSAVEEAIYLTKYAKHVHLLVRSGKLRASRTMQDRALAHPKITVHFNTSVRDAYGSNKQMKGLYTVNGIDGSEKQLPVKGLFYGIGHQPNSKLLEGFVELDEKGYVKVQGEVRTSLDGVYAAGDLHDVEWRQAVTAAGSGCKAAIAVERYLVANDLMQEFQQQKVSQQEEVKEKQEVLAVNSEDIDINQTKHRGQYALRKLYHESDRVIAVFYSSPTCGPCRTLKPIFSSVVEEYAGKMHYIEIDIVEDPDIAESAGVMGTPTIQFFYQKGLVKNLPGVKMKREYRSVISGVLDEAKANVPA